MLKKFEKIKLVYHLLKIKEASKTSFVHLAEEKKSFSPIGECA
jgi:hypothetical protein